MTNTWGNNSTITYTSGIVLDTGTGKTPERTPTELIATRAIEGKAGWLGQIIMAGEIVYETEPQVDVDSDDEEIELGKHRALALVNQRIHDSFKRLIVGV